MPLPDFLIIGAPKAGTTALHAALATHPVLYMSPVKEPEFFCPDNMDGGKLRYPEDMDRYLALFTPSQRHRRVGEASTSYMRSEAAPRLTITR